MKIALVHDYLREYGGAERVLEALHDIWPDAPVYTAFVDRDSLGDHWHRFQGWDIRESWMKKIPGYKKIYSPLRVIAHQFFEQFDFSEYDVVLSSSNMYFAKAVITKPWIPHICYCHTPPRALYGFSTMTDWKKHWWIRICGELINSISRKTDYLTAQRVDLFIANSLEVKHRIKRFYNRDSVVVYPPVTIPKSLPKSTRKKSYFLYVNRFAFNKHPELAIQASNQLGFSLKVVGVGKMLPALQKQAGKQVEFLGAVSDKDLHGLYANAEALIYPVEDEDFGIVPVEAMAFGIPVIAYYSGGPKETIIAGKTGIFIKELTTKAVVEAVQVVQHERWDHQAIQQHAQKFATERFQKEVKLLVQKTVKEFTENK